MSNFEYKEEHELDDKNLMVPAYSEDFEETTDDEENTLENEEYKKRKLMKEMVDNPDYDPVVENAFWCDSTYAIHPSGFFKRKKAKNGDLKWVNIHPFYVIPETLLVVTDDEEVNPTKRGESRGAKQVYVKVRFKSKLGEENTVVLNSKEEAEICSSFSRLVKDASWMPPADKSDIIRAYTNALAQGTREHQRENGKTYPAFIKVLAGYNNRGWVNENTHIRSYHEQYVGNILTKTSEAGSFEVQKEIFIEMIKASPLFALLTAHLFAAYVRGRISVIDISLIITIYGIQEWGKSTIIGFLSSCEGMPRDMVIPTQESTNVGIQQALIAYRDGPFFMEEMDDLLRGGSGTLAQMIMMLSNQGNGVKYSSDAGHQNRGTWNNTIFALGNSDFMEGIAGDMKEGAIETRLETHDIQDPELHTFFYPTLEDNGKVDYWKEMLSKNYGHLYPKIIEEIVNQGDELTQRFFEYSNELRRNKDYKYFNSNKRKSIAVAMAMIGADLMTSVLGEEAGKEAFNAIEIYKNKFAQRDDEVDINKRANFQMLENFYQWINANTTQMYHRGYSYVDGVFKTEKDRKDAQAKYVEQLNGIALKKNGALIADITLTRPLQFKDDYEGEIILNELGKQDLKRRFNIDFKELVGSCRALGMLKTQKSMKNDAIKIDIESKYKLLASSSTEKFTSRQVVILLRPIKDLIEDNIREIKQEKLANDDVYSETILNNSNAALLEDIIKSTEQ